jgi:hypothetical protein
MITHHLHHPDLHAAASKWSEDQTLHVVAVYSNPFRWRTRRELANDFRRHMTQLPNIDLHMVELAYGDRPFEITNPSLYPNDIQLRTGSELFHKENLGNLGVRTFPSDWKYGAFIDADFHFTRHDIALETIHQLQHYDWVQMFSSYVNVSGETEPGHGHRPIGRTSNGFAYGFVRNECRRPAGYNGGWGEPQSGAPQSGITMPWIGAPGGAWAFRRSAFNAVGGLLDRCVLGSADWYMAFGLAGQMLDVTVEQRLGKRVTQYTPAYLEYIKAWQRQAAEALKGNIGYVDSFALHHFHGPMVKRGYSTRDNILISNDYSPVSDVSPDWQGVLQLTASKPRLRDAIRGYFLSRSEDMPHNRNPCPT